MGATLSSTTFTPRRSRRLMVLLMVSSLPGMGCEESTTVSFGLRSNWRFVPAERRPTMEEGSPCEPVHMMTTLWSCICNAWSIGTIISSGISRYLSLRAIFTLSTMLGPAKVILRPLLAAASATCCTREISEAKVAMMTRPLASLNTLSNAGPMTASEGVQPGRSAFVESESSKSTPRVENSESFAKSVGQPSTGVWSNLKSLM